MAAYMRKTGILPVCTNNEARAYFAGRGLTYADVTEGDILTLVMLLNKHIKKANKDCETSMGSMYLSRRIDLKRKTNGTLISCFLYVNSHYFERRECISFNADGWIGFAGWADQGNTNPILRAFIEWCDALAATKEKEDTMTRFKYYSNYLACLLGTLIVFELCWIGAKYVIEGEVVHTCLDHFIAVCGSWYLTRDTMKLWLKLQKKVQK